MACHFGSGIVVCTSDHYARFHIGNKYVWMDYHNYCGPSFWHDRNMSREYVPTDEHDPVWAEFAKWDDKRRAKLANRERGG